MAAFAPDLPPAYRHILHTCMSKFKPVFHRRHEAKRAMNDADIFHEAMLAYGGRFDIESDPRLGWWRSFKPLAEQMIFNTKYTVPQMPEVYFHFVNNPTVQAYAFVHRGVYFIGIFAGTAYILDTIFSRMLSDRRIVPKIGDIQFEVAEPQSLIGLTMHAEHIFAAGLNNSPPRCETRNLFKSRLMALAFQFLVLHEITHIAYGHVDFHLRLGVPFLAELGWTGGTEPECLTRQSWEVMADSRAVILLIQNMPKMCVAQTPPVTLEQGVFLLTFAFCTIFRMFGDATFTGQESTQAYPPRRVRQFLCLLAAETIMDTWPVNQKNACLAMQHDAVKMTEEAFSLLTGEPLAIKGLEQATSPAGRQYAQKLIDHCRSVTVPALRAYSYDPSMLV